MCNRAKRFWCTDAPGGSDWPRFRGPDGAGVSPDTGLPSALVPETTGRWSVPFPAGNSSPIVVGGRLFLTSRLLFLNLGVDYNAQMETADFIVGWTPYFRRGGLFGTGGNFRIEGIPVERPGMVKLQIREGTWTGAADQGWRNLPVQPVPYVIDREAPRWSLSVNGENRGKPGVPVKIKSPGSSVTCWLMKLTVRATS